ncbi:hypothetical protein [Melittangium boletus]|uniref:Uncharacterized protein n=1 Tax=Melittangium boletus DSM 14713 TaxID=1294270 RepID=A0A250ID37_9BACT|nr:hypothetical protein [Melittangium boletus]ATB29759.1 hypothetical protein MEBOL_003214 [Melittangium boletus DSM 14713]
MSFNKQWKLASYLIVGFNDAVARETSRLVPVGKVLMHLPDWLRSRKQTLQEIYEVLERNQPTSSSGTSSGSREKQLTQRLTDAFKNGKLLALELEPPVFQIQAASTSPSAVALEKQKTRAAQFQRSTSSQRSAPQNGKEASQPQSEVYVGPFKLFITAGMNDQNLVVHACMRVFKLDMPAAQHLVHSEGMFVNFSITKEKRAAGFVEFFVEASLYQRVMYSKTGKTYGTAEREAKERRQRFKESSKTHQQRIREIVDQEYTQRAGYKPDGAEGSKGEQQRLREAIEDDVLREEEVATAAAKARLDALPQDVKTLLPGAATAKPEDYAQLTRIGEKLKQLTPEERALYRLLATSLTKDLDQFEKAVDTFLFHRKALTEQIAAATAQQPTGGPTLEDVSQQVWEGFDTSQLPLLSARERRSLARDLSWKQSKAQLKHMLEHPGQTAAGMARSMIRLDEFATAMADDIRAAADGDRYAYSRWAAGLGALSKALGLTAAVLGTVAALIYVGLLFIPGVNVAVLATTALYIGVGMLVLGGCEYVLRIQAAGEATTEASFRAEVDKAAEVTTNTMVGAGMLGSGLLFRFIGRLPLGNRLQNVGAVLKRARETVARTPRGQAFIKWRADLLFELRQKQAAMWAALGQTTKMMMEQARVLQSIKSGKALAERLSAGDPALLELTGLTKEQGRQYQKIVGTPEGHASLERLRQELLRAVHDAPAAMEQQVQRLDAEVKKAIQALEKAATADQAQATLAKVEKNLGEGAVDQAAADQHGHLKERLVGDAPDPEIPAKQWLERLTARLTPKAKKALAELREQMTDTQVRALLENEGGKAYLERQAKLKELARKHGTDNQAATAASKQPTIDAVAEAKASATLDKLEQKLSPTAREQLQSMRRNSESELSIWANVQKQGGASYLEGMAKARTKAKTADKSVLERSSEFVQTFKKQLLKYDFLRRREVRDVLLGKGSAEDKQHGLRGLIAEEVAAEEVLAAHGGNNPGNVLHRGLRVIQEQKGFRSVEEFRADFAAKNDGKVFEGAFPKYGKVYIKVGEIDLLLVEEQPSGKARIRYREEVKSGAGDTPGKAQKQLDEVGRLFEKAAAGDETIRFELPDGVDITKQLDLASDAAALKKHRGPVPVGDPKNQKRYNESLGLTESDLKNLATKLFEEWQAQQQNNGGGGAPTH